MDALEIACVGLKSHYDQGCQFTSADFFARLQAEQIKLNWSGSNRCYEYILVERLLHTAKHAEIYLYPCSDDWELEISLVRSL